MGYEEGTSRWHPRSDLIQRQAKSCGSKSQPVAHGYTASNPFWRQSPITIVAPSLDRPTSASQAPVNFKPRPKSATPNSRATIQTPVEGRSGKCPRPKSAYSTSSRLRTHDTLTDEHRRRYVQPEFLDEDDRQLCKENEPKCDGLQLEPESQECESYIPVSRPSSAPCVRSNAIRPEAMKRRPPTARPRTSREECATATSLSSAHPPQDYAKLEAYRTGSKGASMLRAGIPDRADFPFSASKGWMAARKSENAFFSFNPIRHTVDKFAVKEGRLQQERTHYTIPVPHLNRRKFNRTKGIVEYADITRPTGERWNSSYHERYQRNNRVFYNRTGTAIAFLDTMLRQGYKPNAV